MTSWTVVTLSNSSYDLIKQRASNRYAVEVYSPMTRCLPPARPTVLWKEYKPAFAGYAFVYMVEGWQKVLTIPGVYGMLVNNEQVVTVTQGVIDKIRQAERFRVFDEKVHKQVKVSKSVKMEDVQLPEVPDGAVSATQDSYLKKGTQVYISSGPFEGQSGVVSHELKKGKYVIDVAGTQAKVRFSLLKYLGDMS